MNEVARPNENERTIGVILNQGVAQSLKFLQRQSSEGWHDFASQVLDTAVSCQEVLQGLEIDGNRGGGSFRPGRRGLDHCTTQGREPEHQATRSPANLN